MTYVIVANQPACTTALIVRRGKVQILSQGCREWVEGWSHGYAHAKGIKHKGSTLLPAGDASKLWVASGDPRVA